MKKILTLIVFTLSTLVHASSFEQAVIGEFKMPIFIGERTYHDVVTFKKEGTGLSGQVHVPNAFTEPMTKVFIDEKKRQVVFHIEADEGRGPFEVKYVATFHASNSDFVGFAYFRTLDNENNKFVYLGNFAGKKVIK